MNRTDAIPYIGYAVDDSLAERRPAEAPDDARLVGWQCGFEPMFVAVWSYLPGTTLDDDEAEEIATDLLAGKGWFAGEELPADHII